MAGRPILLACTGFAFCPLGSDCFKGTKGRLPSGDRAGSSQFSSTRSLVAVMQLWSWAGEAPCARHRYAIQRLPYTLFTTTALSR